MGENKIHPAYLFEVKKPEESKYPGDVYKLRDTIPADEAFRPMKDGHCPLINGSLTALRGRSIGCPEWVTRDWAGQAGGPAMSAMPR